MAQGELRLRTTKCLQDFANRITLLLWEGLLRESGLFRPDPHRFPMMSQALNRVLQRRVGMCSVCSDPRYCDVQGGPPREERAPPCQEHGERLREEKGEDLTDLLRELEKETMEFLSRHDPNRAKFQPSLAEDVHRAAEKVIPYLYENIACSRCEGDS